MHEGNSYEEDYEDLSFGDKEVVCESLNNSYDDEYKYHRKDDKIIIYNDSEKENNFTGLNDNYIINDLEVIIVKQEMLKTMEVIQLF
ncbi:hypothetical protein QTN25_002725 [Entamoeba marina]